MADSFIRVVLRDGTTHNVLTEDPAGLVDRLSNGQGWGEASDWVEVEGGGAVTRRLVAASQVAHIELFERS
jgi:hypothetical protein